MSPAEVQDLKKVSGRVSLAVSLPQATADDWVRFGPPDAAMDPKVRHDKERTMRNWMDISDGAQRGLRCHRGDGAANHLEHDRYPGATEIL